jgi:hypothetical protein
MFEDRLREQLRKDLEGPAPVRPYPTQARYQRPAPGGRRPVLFRLQAGGAFVAGAILAGAILSAETGSTNPRVWTVRVTSALSELTQPAPAPLSPSPKAPAPSGGEGSGGADTHGAALPTAVPDRQGRDEVPDGGAVDASEGPSPSRGADDHPATTPPTETPDDRGSSGSAGPTPDPHGHGSPDPTPPPTTTPEREH